jgi:hypothetical protein
MALIEPGRSTEPIDKRLQDETNPVYRRQLEEVAFHIKTEIGGQTERALLRLSPRARYQMYDNTNPPVVLEGVDVIRREFYEALLVSVDPTKQHWDIVRLLVGDGAVVTEGHLRIAMRGSYLVANGIEVEDADALYLSEGWHLVTWPFDEDGRLIGEEIYYGYTTPLEQSARQKLSPEDIETFTEVVRDPS